MNLDADTITATSARLLFTGLEAGHDSIEYQLAPLRPDFNLVVSPRITGIAAGSANSTASGLNQATLYYARARTYDAPNHNAWSPTIAFRTALSAARDTSAVAITHAPAMVVVPQPVLEWTAGNAVAGYPVENLGYDAPVAWRSSHANTHDLYARIGAEPIDTIALLMSNAPEAATVRVQGGNNLTHFNTGGGYSLGPVAFRASPNMPGRPGFHALIRLPAVQSWNWWRVLIENCVTPGGIFHLEHAVFGFNRATKNHSLDRVETPLDLGSLTRNRSGAPTRALGYRMRKEDFDLSAMTEAQFETLYADLRFRVGLTEPLLVVPNSKAGSYLHDRILYGNLSASQVTNLRGPLFSRRFTIESLI